MITSLPGIISLGGWSLITYLRYENRITTYPLVERSRAPRNKTWQGTKWNLVSLFSAWELIYYMKQNLNEVWTIFLNGNFKSGTCTVFNKPCQQLQYSRRNSDFYLLIKSDKLSTDFGKVSFGFRYESFVFVWSHAVWNETWQYLIGF